MEYEENTKKIDNAINKILLVLTENRSKYDGIFLPEDGLGTGLADLQKRAPNTYKYLNAKISNLISLCININ